MAMAEDLLGRAVFACWSRLPRDIQELLFETAVEHRPEERERLAIELHDRHPRTAHPPKPVGLA
jgi:signal transduction histidine kinase